MGNENQVLDGVGSTGGGGKENQVLNGVGSTGGGKDIMKRTIKIYTYPFQLNKQDVLTDGPQRYENSPIKLEGSTMFIWVDLIPEAKFSHPTAYILISGKNTRIERGGYWPVLNGQTILYGQSNPICVASPFELNVDTLEDESKETLLSYIAANPVFSIDNIDLALLKSNPPKLLINVLGSVRTWGWNNAQLLPRVYSHPPSDGIWEFDFVANPPSGVALQYIIPISASYLFDGDFSNWKGVRVCAETNSKERKFGDPVKVADSGHSVVIFTKI